MSSPRPSHRSVLLRTGEILALVTTHGFGSLLDRRHRQSLPTGPGRWTRVRELLEDLGPTFVKMGQMFANRPDLLPEELLVELQKLHDKVPGFAFEQVRARWQAEHDQPLDQAFAEFDPIPVASASVAQVHRARLHDGRRVAVKVLRPGIEDVIATDLEILAHVGEWFERLILRSDVLDARAIVREFSRALRKELDFRQEALSLERFGALFADDPDVCVPRVHRGLSSSSVLVLDFVDGIHPLDHEALKNARLDPRVLARRGADALLKQIFVHGFFHADPHPGNVLIVPDGRVAFLDFGLMGLLPSRHRQALEAMLVALGTADGSALAAALLTLAPGHELDDPQGFEDDVEALLVGIAHVPLAQINVGDFLQRCVALLLTHKITLPPSLYLLVKALLTIEGLARHLDPQFDLIQVVEPFLKSHLSGRFDPFRVGAQGAQSAQNYLALAADLPSEIRQTLQHLRKSRLQLDLREEDLEKVLHKADKISNRLAFALVVTGALLASSLALQSKIPPLWNDIPVIAILGFFGSFILGFALLISIWRSGRF